MDWENFEKQWQSMRETVRQKWSHLTDADLNQIGGKKDEFIRKLQRLYGIDRDKAEHEVSKFVESMGMRPGIKQSQSHPSQDSEHSRSGHKEAI